MRADANGRLVFVQAMARCRERLRPAPRQAQTVSHISPNWTGKQIARKLSMPAPMAQPVRIPSFFSTGGVKTALPENPDCLEAPAESLHFPPVHPRGLLFCRKSSCFAQDESLQSVYLKTGRVEIYGDPGQSRMATGHRRSWITPFRAAARMRGDALCFSCTVLTSEGCLRRSEASGFRQSRGASFYHVPYQRN